MRSSHGVSAEASRRLAPGEGARRVVVRSLEDQDSLAVASRKPPLCTTPASTLPLSMTKTEQKTNLFFLFLSGDIVLRQSAKHVKVKGSLSSYKRLEQGGGIIARSTDRPVFFRAGGASAPVSSDRTMLASMIKRQRSVS